MESSLWSGDKKNHISKKHGRNRRKESYLGSIGESLLVKQSKANWNEIVQ